MNKQNSRKMPQETGITLIALVVTIIVLLILAGITITVVLGENGIISMAKRAVEQTNRAMQHEKEELENLIGWTQNYLNGSNQGGEDIPKEEYYYSVPDLLDRIAPSDLFEYEIIENGNFESTEYKALPKKTARIKRIKYEYCNEGQDYGWPGPEGYECLNYNIIYKGNQIAEELIIPYKTTIEGEEYTITEVGLGAGSVTPNVKTIIYPNTVYKIFNADGNEEKLGSKYSEGTNIIYVENVVLPQHLQEIGDYALVDINSKTISIPSSVRKIGKYAFAGSTLPSELKLPDQLSFIDDGAFYYTKGLETIEIPNGVVSIPNRAFDTSEIKNIKLPSNLQSIGDDAFSWCLKLKKIVIPSSVKTIGTSAFRGPNNIQILLRRTRKFYSRCTLGSI